MRKLTSLMMGLILVPAFLSAQSPGDQSLEPAVKSESESTIQAPPPIAEQPGEWNYPPELEAKKGEPKSGKTGRDPKDWGTDYWHGTVRVNWWNADYDSEMNAVEESNGVLIGKTVDVKDDLDLETPVSAWEIEFWARPTKRNRIMGSYFMSQYSGSVDDLTQKVEFNGKIFEVNMDVDTEIMINRASLYYQYLPLANERGGIGPLIGVEYYNYAVRLESETLDEKTQESLNLPIPVVGVAGDYTLGYGLGVWGRFGWIGASVEDVSASYMDLEAGVSFKWKLLYAGVSYRSLVYRLESGKEDEDGYIKLDGDQSGVLASLGVNF